MPTETLNHDQRRLVLAKLCRAINKLVCRALSLVYARDPMLVVASLKPPSKLLEGMNPGMAISGVTGHLLRVQEHLLAQIDGTLPVDAFEACRVLQHLAGDRAMTWSTPVRRLADALQYELPETPATYERHWLAEVDEVLRQKRNRGE